MNNSMTRFTAIVAIVLALMMPINKVFADSENEEFKDSESFKKLSAEWWQWALSIPASVNPQLDKTGEGAVVGQRGSVWFLAGVFNGGTVVRNMIFVPEGTALFFPVINSVNINTPGVCGQPGTLTVSELQSAALFDPRHRLLFVNPWPGQPAAHNADQPLGDHLLRPVEARQENAGGVANLVGNHRAFGSFELEGSGD